MIGSSRGCPIGSLSGPWPSGDPPRCSRPPLLSLRAPSFPGTLRPRLPGDAQVALAESLRWARARRSLSFPDASCRERAPARGRRAPGGLGLVTPPGTKGGGRSPNFKYLRFTSRSVPSNIQILSTSSLGRALGSSQKEEGEQMFARHRTCRGDVRNFLFGKDSQSAKRSRRAQRLETE